MQFAAALQVGVTSESEYLDAWLTARLDGRFPDDWIDRLNAVSPPGLRVYDIRDVPIKDPALPTQVSTSEFVITPLDDTVSADDLRARVATLLAQPTIERETQNNKRYDLRPRILDLSVDADGRPDRAGVLERATPTHAPMNWSTRSACRWSRCAFTAAACIWITPHKPQNKKQAAENAACRAPPVC